MPAATGRELVATLRGLWRHRGFTATAVLTLALGIGATTALFGIIYGVLLEPLPYPDPDALVSVRHTAPGHPFGLDGAALGSADSMYVTYRDENRSFEHLGLWSASERTLTGLGEPERIRTLAVTDGTLQALGVPPLLGRWFTASEHAAGPAGPDPVIVSYAFWQRRFGGETAALGRALALDARAAQIVGIMPPGFRFLTLTPQPDIIIPSRIDVGRLTLGNLNSSGLARLREGVTLADANADVARMLPIWLDAWPPGGGSREAVADWRIAPALEPLKDSLVGSVAVVLWVLMAAVGGVLLIACANVANLLLVRADARRQELAIRAALGASRRRVAAELVRESVVLGAIASVVGIALAFAGLEILAALAPTNLPRIEAIAIGPAELAFSIATALVASLLLGAPAALRYALGNGPVLDATARSVSIGPARHRARDTMIVVQVALALVLLVGAGLMIRTFVALSAVEPGFRDPESIQLARVFVAPAVMAEPARYNRAFRDMLERIDALPGVTATSFGGVPLQGPMGLGTAIVVDGGAATADRSPPMRRIEGTAPGYFEALGTGLVAGREFSWADSEESRHVVLVSETLARALWGEPQAALGKRIRDVRDAPDVWHEVIGVARDVHETLYERPPPTVYWPADLTSDLRAITYVIRSRRAGTESFVNELRQAVWATHSDLPVFAVRTLQDVYAESLARVSFMLVLLAVAATLALLLSLVGTYGVIAYIVAQRSREIGIRLALGAEPTDVRHMLMRHSLGVATLGAGCGLAAAAALGRWLQSLLFGVQPIDPATYLAVLGTLLATVSLAAYLPARRAARLDPADTLRAE